MRSSWTRAQTRVLCIGRRILNHCATREAQLNNLKRCMKQPYQMSSSKLDLRLRLGITPRQKAIMWHPTKGPPCGLFFRNSLHIDGIALTDIYSLIPFLRVRNLGVAYWGDSGLGFLMRLPPSCRPGLQSSQGSMAAGESDSKLHCVVVGRKLQFLTGCWPEVSIPHHMDLSIGCFGVLRMWKLVPREGLVQMKRREREYAWLR